MSTTTILKSPRRLTNASCRGSFARSRGGRFEDEGKKESRPVERFDESRNVERLKISRIGESRKLFLISASRLGCSTRRRGIPPGIFQGTFRSSSSLIQLTLYDSFHQTFRCVLPNLFLVFLPYVISCSRDYEKA